MKREAQIVSLQNKKLKTAIQLRDRKTRKVEGRFSVEGAREINRALCKGFKLIELYVCTEIFSEISRSTFKECEKFDDVHWYPVNKKCFAKLAVRNGVDGLVAVIEARHLTLEDLVDQINFKQRMIKADTENNVSRSGLIVIAENIEKPGNLGALLRTADAVGVDALVVIGDSVDLYNPNVIRSSVGSVFTVPVIECSDNGRLADFLAVHEFRSFGAALSDHAQNYLEQSYNSNLALFLGSEADGLSDFWLRNCDQVIKIPMAGVADSLNISVAGAIILYEVYRQRLVVASC